MYQTMHKLTSGTALNQPHAVAVAMARALESSAAPHCCSPRELPGAVAGPTGRNKLRTLPTRIYCSILGTCFTTLQLRKLLARCTKQSVEHLDDLQVHEEAVQLAAMNDEGCRIFHKALDQHHQIAIKRFEKAKTPDDILALWEEAKRIGDIPGAYWATLTHRAATPRLHDKAFGDVHMLSHLVGAANRADIRRLAILESENAELTEKIERQQRQLRDSIVTRDDTIRRLSDQLAEKLVNSLPVDQEDDSEHRVEIATLRELASTLQRRLSNEIARRERAEARALGCHAALNEAKASLTTVLNEQKELQRELQAAERHLHEKLKSDSDDALHDALYGRTILYVGGRPGSTQAIRDLVLQADGTFIAHDGGIEQRQGLLAGEVNRADLVFFPVDCISHDAALSVKRLCHQATKPYRPLRTASVASFLAALLSESAATAP